MAHSFFIKKCFESIARVLFPPRCVVCKKNGTGLCTPCSTNLPLADELDDARLYAVFDYGSPIVRSIIHDAKYYHHGDGLRALTHLAVPYISEHLADELHGGTAENITFVPIPQHRQKTRARGFNQSKLIAEACAQEMVGARVAPLLTKTRATRPQAHTRNKKERFENIAGSFTSKPINRPEMLYIIVDDVITTGATVLEAIRALKHAGVRHVRAVALAHGYKRN